MKHLILLAFLSCLLTVSVVQGQAQTNDIQTRIEEAMSAGPPSISANATILDYPSEPGGEMIVLREGTNEWTCLPDNPNMPGKNPMCIDSQVMELLLKAIPEKRAPNITRTGFGYFLQGGAPRSNTNPWDNSPTPDNEWMEQGPHIVVVSPDKEILKGLPTNSDNGGPWVMWRNTPYVHIMIPVTKYIPE